MRIRDRMNAWYDANDSLGGGPLAASVTASAVSSSRRACGASTWLNDTRVGCPSAPALAARQRSSSRSTWEVTQPSRSIPAPL